jgi:hypothetical protein
MNTHTYNKNCSRLIIPKWEEISSFTQNYKNTTNSSNTTNTRVFYNDERGQIQ